MPVPADDVLAWVAAAVGSARVTGVDALAQSGDGGPWRLALDGPARDARAVLHLGDAADADARSNFATEAAALELAARHGLAAPCLLAADLDGSASGRLALVTSVLEGSSRIPEALPPARLRALGREAAAIHAVAVEPDAALPVRRTPLAGVPFETVEAPPGSEALFADARAAARTLPAPAEPAGFVHGDLWQGNALWGGDRLTGIVDWDFAGVGPAGIDVGSLRCDAAVMFGEGGPGHVLDGWREARRGEELDVAWWDLVAALSSPADLRLWLPNFHAQGRTDLDLATATERRDAFLAAALRALG